MSIHVSIERMILDGFAIPAGMEPLIRRAMLDELRSLVLEFGLASAMKQGQAMPELRVSPILVSGEARPAEIGRLIARAVYQSIGSTPSSHRAVAGQAHHGSRPLHKAQASNSTLQGGKRR